MSNENAPDLRMYAYYYGFEPTGVREIDLILSAVACAGKAFHETADWRDEARPYDGHTGATPVEWIQNAANAAADSLRAALAQPAAQPVAPAGWIPVSERLPEHHQNVLLNSESWPRPRVLMFACNHDHPRFIDQAAGLSYWYPERMHWMPLPAAPTA